MNTSQLWDSLCSKTVHYLDIYNQGKICSELVNWIYQGFEALLILSSLVRFTETLLEQSWSSTNDISVPTLFQRPVPPALKRNKTAMAVEQTPSFLATCCVFRVVFFFPWGNLRVIQHTSASIQDLDHLAAAWPRQGLLPFPTTPGDRRGQAESFWLKAGDFSKITQEYWAELLWQSRQGKVMRNDDQCTTKNGKLRRLQCKTTT